MYVINRLGEKEDFDFTKTKEKLLSLCPNRDSINIDIVVRDVISAVTNGIKTSDIDLLSAKICFTLSEDVPEYAILAYNILRNNLDKTYPDFVTYLNNVNLRPDIKNKMSKLALRKWDVSYISLNILKGSYLMTGEKPEYMLARVACEISNEPQTTFELMFSKTISFASPILYYSGLEKPQLGSCYVLSMEDNIEDIINVKGEALLIAARGGGIGLTLDKIRCSGSPVNNSKNGAFGIPPLLESINKDFQMIKQGANKRNANIVIWLSPWHPDFKHFLKAGNELSRVEAKDIFYGIWIPDEFMMRVKNKDMWWFTNTDLSDCYGEEFSQKYQSSNKVEVMSAIDLWKEILLEQCSNRKSLYVMFSDNVNKVSNVKDIGIIRSSNLCCEIVEPTNFQNTAVCNLASINLAKCLTNKSFDFNKLKVACYECVKCLNNIIDVGLYNSEKSKHSNQSLRPIGIGIQALQDMFVDLGIPFKNGGELMFKISEAIYYYCLEASYELAKLAKPHEHFEKTELAKGIFHFEHFKLPYPLTLDWETLRQNIIKYGVRNSQLIALMPTATSADIMGNSPCFEQYTSLIYKRRLADKEFVVIVDKLYVMLKNKGLWKEPLITDIKRTGNFPSYFQDKEIRDLFQVAYDDPYVAINMAVVRQPFVDQAQSLNWFIQRPTPKILNELYFHSWNSGLKNGNYYLHKSVNKKEIECNRCVA